MLMVRMWFKATDENPNGRVYIRKW
jgi:hypothetical protein